MERGREEEKKKCTCASLRAPYSDPIVAVARRREEDAAFSSLNNARPGLLCSVCKSALE